MMSTGAIDRVRRFNRAVTQRVGALNDRFLGRGRPLGEARVLYEIGVDGIDVRTLRSRLGLDSGYTSRLLRSLQRQSLIRVAPSPDDGRVRRVRLSAKGRREYAVLNRRSNEVAAAMLGDLSPSHRQRLVDAMTEVERLLRSAVVVIEATPPDAPSARWCLAQYFDELADRFRDGFDPSRSIPARDGQFVPPTGLFLVATTDDEPVGCGGFKTVRPRAAYVKRMWIADSVRGTGLGRRLLVALERHAREMGFEELELETNDTLREAIALYRSHGYREVAPFNDEPYAHHWFRKRLTP